MKAYLTKEEGGKGRVGEERRAIRLQKKVHTHARRNEYQFFLLLYSTLFGLLDDVNRGWHHLYFGCLQSSEQRGMNGRGGTKEKEKDTYYERRPCFD